MISRVAALRAAATALSTLIALACLASCGLLVSFDDFDTGGAGGGGGGAQFVVGGLVDGLGSDPNATVSLSLNAGPVLVAHDGHFAFPEKLGDGARFGVTIAESPGFSCSLTAGGTGQIAGHDVDDVAVHCTSAEVLLSSLTLSTGPLSPTFVPTTTSYSAGPVHVPVVPGATTSAILNAKSSKPAALITLPGAPPVKGEATAMVKLGLGLNPFAIDVTAPDGRAKGTYALAVTGEGSSVYLKAPAPKTFDIFGGALALDGDTLAIGALGESSNLGAVYVLTRTGGAWKPQAHLVAPDAPAGALFGCAVALAGDTLVVGARGESTFGGGAGAAYVFTRTGVAWALQAKLTAAIALIDATFGHAVAISGNTVAVAAPGEAVTTNPIAGAIHVFTRTGTIWSLPTLLRAMNPLDSQRLGESLALDGDMMAVGEPSKGSSSGRAHVFTRSSVGTWTQGTLTPLVASVSADAYGYAVAIAGDTIVVGASGESSGAGAIHVFTHSVAKQTWTQTALLKAPNPQANARLGTSIALFGDVMAAGALQEPSDARGVDGDEANARAKDAGAAFLFDRSGTTWTKRVYLKPSNTTVNLAFGGAIALGRDTVVVGAVREASGKPADPNDASQPAAGAVYAF